MIPLNALPGTIALGGSQFWYGTTAILAMCPSGSNKEADT